MSYIFRIIVIKLIFLFGFIPAYANDSAYLKIHFLYGSKPAKDFKKLEKKWFGGIHGGHVGIESDSNFILNFLKDKKFHVFGRKNIRHSKFEVNTYKEFYELFAIPSDSVKFAIVYVPISKLQKQKFDSISQCYTSTVPYDYAFIGMRCAAAAYDVLSQMELFPKHSRNRMVSKIFYPKKLRKRILKKAEENNWKIIRQEGSERRKWERD